MRSGCCSSSRRCGLAAFCAFAGAALAASDPLVLASRAPAADPYAIVVRAAASPCERYAAEELRTFLKRMTDRDLAVVTDEAPVPSHAILIGHTRHAPPRASTASPGDEGFHLQAEGTRLHILGGTGRGPLYGVYELLERFGGCAWYAPGFEVVPRCESFAVPGDLDEVQRPAFALRSTNWNGFGRELAFAARNRLNLEGFGPELGGSRFRFDPVLGACHTFDALVPPAKHFAAHPDYFAEVEGVRRGERTQLCLTHPEVLRLATETVRARLAVSYPQGIRYYGVSPNDWMNGCECAACTAVNRREKSAAGTLIAFVNAIAENVEKDYPEAIISTLAYSYTRRPPATLVPRRNVQICICTIECDTFRSLVESRARENAQVRHDFARWARGGGPLRVWDYIADYAAPLHPWPNFRSLPDNLRFYRAQGVTEVFSLGTGGGAEDVWNNLRHWFVAKGLWNPDRNWDDLTVRAFRDHFGPGAGEVYAAWRILQEAPRDTKRFPQRCFESAFAPGLDSDTLRAADAHLERAVDRTRGTPFAARTAQARLPLDFMLAQRGAARPRLAGAPVLSDAADDRARAKRVLAAVDRPGGVRLADDAAGRYFYRHRLHALARMPALPPSATRLRLEDWNLTGDYPVTAFERVDDPRAKDGRAVRLPGTRAHARAWFDLRALHRARETPCEIRFRLRAVPSRGLSPSDGSAGTVPVRLGLYDTLGRRHVVYCEPSWTEVGAEYRWYSLGTCVPPPESRVWVGVGTVPAGAEAAADVFIDCLEVVVQP